MRLYYTSVHILTGAVLAVVMAGCATHARPQDQPQPEPPRQVAYINGYVLIDPSGPAAMEQGQQYSARLRRVATPTTEMRLNNVAIAVHPAAPEASTVSPAQENP